MAEKRYYRWEEDKFQAGQKRAAMLLVEREFLPKSERKTMEEIADDVGVVRKTLYNWNTKDENFIAFKKYLSANYLDTHMPMVYARLLETIDKRYSVRAMELFMKRAGDLTDHQELTIVQDEGSPKDFAEQEKALLERLGKVEGETASKGVDS